MRIINKRDFAIKISGSHYFACDYVFSNIYGESVFFEDTDTSFANASPGLAADLTADLSPEEISEDTLRETLPETPYDGISTLPECQKEIEYMTEGSVQQLGGNEFYIRYGSDESPMCIHIRGDGSVTLSGDDSDVAEIIFEQGKRNFIALPESAFGDPQVHGLSDDYETHAPLHLCVCTEQIDNRMTNHGGSLSVSYSIEVNGMIAEVTDFTLTADDLSVASAARSEL